MAESEPKPTDVGRIFYDGHEAWTVVWQDTGPIWVRVPQMDAKLFKDSNSSRGSDPSQRFHKPYTQTRKDLRAEQPAEGIQPATSPARTEAQASSKSERAELRPERPGGSHEFWLANWLAGGLAKIHGGPSRGARLLVILLFRRRDGQ
jgi:hypothetical protein